MGNGTTSISNAEDVIDSRDVIARIEELEGERESAFLEPVNAEAYAEMNGGTEPFVTPNGDSFKPDEWDDEREDEYQALKALADEAEGYAEDWKYGSVLVRDSYFTEYCEQMLEDIGDLPKDLPGYIAIDWEKTAENLQVDYTAVEFDGVTYWIR